MLAVARVAPVSALNCTVEEQASFTWLQVSRPASRMWGVLEACELENAVAVRRRKVCTKAHGVMFAV